MSPIPVLTRKLTWEGPRTRTPAGIDVSVTEFGLYLTLSTSCLSRLPDPMLNSLVST